jgi:hypothetical protein
MRASRILVAFTALATMVAVGSATPTTAWSQTSDHLQQVDKRLADKRAAAEAHRKQMEGIKDPDQLSVELRKHFQMTEEMLALMLERKKMIDTHAPKTATPSTPSQPAQPSPGSGMPGSGMQGGGMMQKEMGGMQGPGGVAPGGMMQKEMGGMQGGSGMPGMSGSAGPPTAPGSTAAPQPSRDTDEMMRRIAEHSAYMETIQDRATLGQEMLRHQKMLDQMLQFVQ